MSLFAEGKAIHRRDPEKKKFFIYTHLKKMVAGPGKTGIRFSLKQDITKLPVANASITVQPGNYILYPNAKGVAEQLLGAGDYTYTITAPGEATVTGSIKVKAGSVRRADVVFTQAQVSKPVDKTADNNNSNIDIKTS